MLFKEKNRQTPDKDGIHDLTLSLGSGGLIKRDALEMNFKVNYFDIIKKSENC